MKQFKNSLELHKCFTFIAFFYTLLHVNTTKNYQKRKNQKKKLTPRYLFLKYEIKIGKMFSILKRIKER